MRNALLEVAANSVASALAAEAGGAARVELCAALEVGGVTPSHAAVALACERLRIPVFVLIRARPGDFVYDDIEFEVMRRDIEACKALGCAGVVIGALDPDGNVDVPHCRMLMDAARGVPVTFHRAFDFARDPFAALDAIIDLGCARLLTSGQADDALAGASMIRQLVNAARGRITVMPGGGIGAANIAAIRDATGASEYHASAKKPMPSRMHVAPSRIGNMDACDWQTDAEGVRARLEALHAATSAVQT